MKWRYPAVAPGALRPACAVLLTIPLASRAAALVGPKRVARNRGLLAILVF
jgi:hypothetical protein